MQLGDPSVLKTSSAEAMMAATAGSAAPEVVEAHEGINGGVDTNSGDEKRNGGGGDEGDKIYCGGNRWSRQETFALLKIRSDMDAVFRDSSLKGPLWEEVSRKLAELGYHRNAKKCKEKFENVYKYHKRTKESRSGKPEGKTYKFFDQLRALEDQFTVSHHHQTSEPQPLSTTSNTVTTTTISYVTTVPSTNPTVNISPSSLPPPPPPTTNNATTITTTSTAATNPRINLQSQQGTVFIPCSLPNINNLFSTTSTSSSTASDEDMEERYRKKRKWKDYFRKLTRQVLAKQEEMQKRFLEAIDKRERERVAQQEAWRIQEMARINREHDILVQERSTAAAKDAAVIAFLQKLSGQKNPTLPPPPATQLPPPPPPPPQPQVQPQQHQTQQPQQMLQSSPALLANNSFEIQKMNNGHSALSPMSSSRWPKAEVLTLIRIRTSLDVKYEENGPKGPLWEDISAGMQRLGYNRSAKRCKEKWENINKYFKKVKESNKQRREDSKTCPYFDELEALYKEKSKTHNPFSASFYNAKTNEMMEPLMVQPEQQWRPPPQYDQQQQKQQLEEGVVIRENEEEQEEEEDIDDVEEDRDSVEDEGRYEVATNKLSSVDTIE